ncbi:hypothetical protein EVAR_47455_1 [Eumeta japonica]|uniref:Uncharacterized protein n=1 Tax=Eumeta variegata TaxID=151549 RepID=A0A4C1XEP9_EUMVA|nr:hypothetical protein EVAR_47455_1 [Eumeta japonica]
MLGAAGRAAGGAGARCGQRKQMCGTPQLSGTLPAPRPPPAAAPPVIAPPPSLLTLSIQYPIPTREVSNTLVTHLGLCVSVDSDDHLPLVAHKLICPSKMLYKNDNATIPLRGNATEPP